MNFLAYDKIGKFTVSGEVRARNSKSFVGSISCPHSDAHHSPVHYFGSLGFEAISLRYSAEERRSPYSHDLVFWNPEDKDGYCPWIGGGWCQVPAKMPWIWEILHNLRSPDPQVPFTQQTSRSRNAWTIVSRNVLAGPRVIPFHWKWRQHLRQPSWLLHFKLKPLHYSLRVQSFRILSRSGLISLVAWQALWEASDIARGNS